MSKDMNISGMLFKFSKYDKLDGTVVCEWKQEVEEKTPFCIKASKNGMWFEGNMIGDIFGENELQKFAQLISMAWEEHRKLKVKIISSLTGH